MTDRLPRAVRLAALLVALTALSGCAASGAQTAGQGFVAGSGTVTVLPVAERAPAPSVSGPTLDGERLALADFAGQVVVVNVWGSWCGPCKLEFPYFQEAVRRVGRRVGFLGVNVIDSREGAERFLAERPVPYPSLEDGNARISQEAAPGARGAPITVFYDAAGERSYVHQGQYESAEELLADIDRYATGA